MSRRSVLPVDLSVNDAASWIVPGIRSRGFRPREIPSWNFHRDSPRYWIIPDFCALNALEDSRKKFGNILDRKYVISR